MTGPASAAATYLLLCALLAASVTIGEGHASRAGTLVVLAFAASKIAVVVSEYIEIRGSARWLVATWATWTTAVTLTMTALLVT